MRDAKLILCASVCDANLYQGGPESVAQVVISGRSYCPHMEACSTNGFLDPHHGHQCVMMLGLQAAQAAIRQQISIAAVMEQYEDDIPPAPQGFVYSDDRQTFTVIPRAEALVKIAEFVRVVIGGQSGPQENPCVKENQPATRPMAHLRYEQTPGEYAVEDFLTNLC